VAVKNVEGVSTVESDMDRHTMTVGFDDGVTSLDQIVSALNDAGYVVKERRELP
jgi:copper chaperone CopZ